MSPQLEPTRPEPTPEQIAGINQALPLGTLQFPNGERQLSDSDPSTTANKITSIKKRVAGALLALTPLIALSAVNFEDLSGEGASAEAHEGDVEVCVLYNPDNTCSTWVTVHPNPTTTPPTTTKPPPTTTTPPTTPPPTTTTTTTTKPPQPLLDTDNEGIPDAVEQIIGTNITNPDTDGDGESDSDEAGTEFMVTIPEFLPDLDNLDPTLLLDTDGDGKPDIIESDQTDQDNDGTVDELDPNDNDPNIPNSSTTTTSTIDPTTTSEATDPTTPEATDPTSSTGANGNLIATPTTPDNNNGSGSETTNNNLLDKARDNPAATALGTVLGAIGVGLFIRKRRREEDDQNFEAGQRHD